MVERETSGAAVGIEEVGRVETLIETLVETLVERKRGERVWVEGIEVVVERVVERVVQNIERASVALVLEAAEVHVPLAQVVLQLRIVERNK